MHLEVHPHTHRAIIKHYGSPQIRVDASSPLLPVLLVKPHRQDVSLTKTIHVVGPADIIAQIRADAGYNLYRHHHAQLMDWITLHVARGAKAYTAMMEYYDAVGMDIADLDPSSVYRQWYRLQQRKNSKNNAHIHACDVLENVHRRQGALSDALEVVSKVIHAHPDVFYGRSGQPDAGMIRKAMIYALHRHCRWSQDRIAEVLDIHRSGISRHLQSFSPYTSTLCPNT